MLETLLIEAIQRFLTFSNSVIEFPSTYHGEIIVKESASGAKRYRGRRDNRYLLAHDITHVILGISILRGP